MIPLTGYGFLAYILWLMQGIATIKVSFLIPYVNWKYKKYAICCLLITILTAALFASEISHTI